VPGGSVASPSSIEVCVLKALVLKELWTFDVYMVLFFFVRPFCDNFEPKSIFPAVGFTFGIEVENQAISCDSSATFEEPSVLFYL
jgi:hypothetical protein